MIIKLTPVQPLKQLFRMTVRCNLTLKTYALLGMMGKQQYRSGWSVIQLVVKHRFGYYCQPCQQAAKPLSICTTEVLPPAWLVMEPPPSERLMTTKTITSLNTLATPHSLLR